jgi:hypothetical protein
MKVILLLEHSIYFALGSDGNFVKELFLQENVRHFGNGGTFSRDLFTLFINTSQFGREGM